PSISSDPVLRLPPSFPTRRSSDLSPKPFRLSVEVGSLHSPIATVSGRLLLAAMKPDALAEFLDMQPDYLTMSSAQRRDFHERLADRKSTRLNSSHVKISYAVFCLN